MTRQELLLTVYNHVLTDPSIIQDLNNAIMQGVQDRLVEETILRANAETALVMCYQRAKSKLTAVEFDVVVKVLKNAAIIAGTTFQRSLK